MELKLVSRKKNIQNSMRWIGAQVIFIVIGLWFLVGVGTCERILSLYGLSLPLPSFHCEIRKKKKINWYQTHGRLKNQKKMQEEKKQILKKPEI